MKYIVSKIDGDYGEELVVTTTEDTTTIIASTYIAEHRDIKEALTFLRKKLGIKKFNQNLI